MTTLSSYQQIASNLTRWQTLTAKTPGVAQATAYYSANIGKVKSADDLLANPRLFAFAMSAFGLDDMVQAKGLMRKVLAGGVEDSQALANTLNNPKILAFARAFDFAGSGDAVTGSTTATSDVVSAYVRNKLEATQGASNDGVRLALYFSRNASRISNVYDILADKSLLSVVQTAVGISPMTSAQNIDTQAATLKKLVKIADFSDPTKLGQFISRFAARYDANRTGAAISGAATGTGFSADLLLSLQGARLGTSR